MAGAIQGSAVTLEGRQVGTIESIDIWTDPGNAARFNVVVKASFADFAADLDRFLEGKGIFQNRCSRRIYWVGDSAVIGAGSALHLSSRVRYEQWACSSLGDARLLRETRSVRWSVSVPRAPLDRIAVTAALDDIVDFPDAAERMFGLRGTGANPDSHSRGMWEVRLRAGHRDPGAGVRSDHLLAP